MTAELGIDQLIEIVESRGQLLGQGYSRPLYGIPLLADGSTADIANAVSYSLSDTEITVTKGTADRSTEKAYITVRYTRNTDRQWPITNLKMYRYDYFVPELENAERFAVSQPFYLDAGVYELFQDVVTVGNPVMVLQTEYFTGGTFPSSDGYYHIDDPGFYRFQLNKDIIDDPYTPAELEALSRSATINIVL